MRAFSSTFFLIPSRVSLSQGGNGRWIWWSDRCTRHPYILQNFALNVQGSNWWNTPSSQETTIRILTKDGSRTTRLCCWFHRVFWQHLWHSLLWHIVWAGNPRQSFLWAYKPELLPTVPLHHHWRKGTASDAISLSDRARSDAPIPAPALP